ncbi:serine/threonine-protein kinase [Myxococcus sp. MxC21-1]|uniref:serine/threonine-protein kinase n=1 Tax=Myxococcus sp. MxC21-1 TaxID=3041439 RepID=UPI00292DB71F|nr:serine/threonine-protein kinase [Myxococcus sp. MxC21-1]WNZ60263.1 serine/threonine-protein kinase [Myxococcus sp. MxC21-1]
MNPTCPTCHTPHPGAEAGPRHTCAACGADLTHGAQTRGTPQEPDLTGESLAGFQLNSRLDTDATGWLYAAEGHVGPCVVKVMSSSVAADAEARARFHREAETLRSLRHPGIVRVLAVGEERGHCWYALEPVIAADLETRLDRVNALPFQEVEQLALRLLDALGAAHETGLVHGDVRPQNILLAKDGAMLTNFGLSLVPPGAHGYQAPEQRQWGRAVPQSDLHALGRVLHEALTGGMPETQPLPQGVPRHLRRLLKGLLSEAIQDRPDSAISARRLLTQRAPLGPLVVGVAALLAMLMFLLLRAA